MNSRITTIAFLHLVILFNSCNSETPVKTDSEPSTIDLMQVRELLQELDNQFAESFNDADSVAIAEHYTKDGTFGSIKGRDNLVSAWGRSIRYARENGTPNLKFKISSVSNDGEFVVEIGSFETSDLNDVVKSTGKYLVVRKLEDGKWKIFRDIGL